MILAMVKTRLIKLLVIVIALFVLLFSLLMLGIFMGGGSLNDTGQITGINLSEAVLAHKGTVEYYCEQYGISDYVWYILAIMQVESGGAVEDVMQSSESLGLAPNSLSTEESIEQGCYYFSCLLDSAQRYDCDIDTVIQSYNYGGGFLYYVADNGNAYSYELAVAFAKEKSGGEITEYNNAIAIAKNGGWRYRYGNMFYVLLVRQYLVASGTGGFIWPSTDSVVITSVYGDRVHPISGVNRHHNGIDIGASWGTDVLAAANGTVTRAGYYESYGNCIIIDHGNGYTTLYAHMSQLLVSVGDTVRQGETIGLVGSTGDSTGAHLHWEVRYNGALTDPLSYFSESQYTYG